MANVKLLLKESVKHLGRVGDIVEVSAGYARNYLLPNELAVQPTPGNMKKVEERRKEIERIEQERRAAQAALVQTLSGVEVTLERRANEQGHLFGSVTATDIAKALRAQGHAIEAEDINLHGKIDRIDKFTVRVEFAADLGADVTVYVAPDAESKAAIEAYAKQRQAEAAEQQPA